MFTANLLTVTNTGYPTDLHDITEQSPFLSLPLFSHSRNSRHPRSLPLLDQIKSNSLLIAETQQPDRSALRKPTEQDASLQSSLILFLSLSTLLSNSCIKALMFIPPSYSLFAGDESNKTRRRIKPHVEKGRRTTSLIHHSTQFSALDTHALILIGRAQT